MPLFGPSFTSPHGPLYFLKTGTFLPQRIPFPQRLLGYSSWETLKDARVSHSATVHPHRLWLCPRGSPSPALVFERWIPEMGAESSCTRLPGCAFRCAARVYFVGRRGGREEHTWYSFPRRENVPQDNSYEFWKTRGYKPTSQTPSFPEPECGPLWGWRPWETCAQHLPTSISLSSRSLPPREHLFPGPQPPAPNSG